MKEYILKTLFFIIPIVIVSFIFDVFLTSNLKKSNIHAQTEYPTWNTIFNGSLDDDILIMGSSRAWTQIDPEIIQDSLKLTCFNLGMDGHRFLMQHLRYTLAIKNNKTPKIIIQEVDLGTLTLGKGLYNPDQFLPYMFWNSTMKMYLDKLNGFTFYDYYIPLVRYYGKTDAIKTVIKNIVLPAANKPRRTKGYQGQNKSWNGDFDKAKKTLKYYNASIDSSIYNLFSSYVKQLKKENIDLILTYPPEYYESSSFVKNRDEIIGYFEDISNKHNILFLDFSMDSISFSKSYFINSTHLNKVGAELYTRKLVSAIKHERTTTHYK